MDRPFALFCLFFVVVCIIQSQNYLGVYCDPCLEHHYGNNCSTYCNDDIENIHYTCNNVTGEKNCRAGYYGTNCTVHCTTQGRDAIHYRCNNKTGEKECFQGYYGNECSTYCIEKNEGHYTCNNQTGEKECFRDYYGHNCSTYCNATGLNLTYACNNVTGEKICMENYYNENCSMFCNDHDRLQRGIHYRCDTDGTKRCFQDYYGPNCTLYYPPPKTHKNWFRTTTGEAIVIVIALLLVIALFAFITWKIRKYRSNSLFNYQTHFDDEY